MSKILKPNDRLDNSETVYFSRELESIDATTYRLEYADLKARSFLPTQGGVHPDAKTYTYRYTEFRHAASGATLIGAGTDDLPRADVVGGEVSQNIHDFGASFGYNLSEIRAAAMAGTSLDADRAASCRRMLEEKLDSLLALGDTTLDLKGILKLSNTTSFTLGTKASGAATAGIGWGTLAAPTATGEEMAQDIMAMCTTLHEATKEKFNRFTVVLPTAKFNMAMMTRMGDGSNVSALAYAKAQCQYLADVQSWDRCNTASGTSGTRAMAYAKDPRVISALVPREYEQMAPQQKNFSFIINAMLRCGGVVNRFPVAVCYGDGL